MKSPEHNNGPFPTDSLMAELDKLRHDDSHPAILLFLAKASESVRTEVLKSNIASSVQQIGGMLMPKLHTGEELNPHSIDTRGFHSGSVSIGGLFGGEWDLRVEYYADKLSWPLSDMVSVEAIDFEIYPNSASDDLLAHAPLLRFKRQANGVNWVVDEDEAQLYSASEVSEFLQDIKAELDTL